MLKGKYMRINKRFSAAALAVLMAASLFGCGGENSGSEKIAVTPIEGSCVPLTAVYDAPASDWEQEAMPLGNGYIGAMVFGGVESDRIQINEHTLWSGGPGADSSYDGGMGHNTKEENYKNLMAAREGLQQLAIEFSENNAAYKKDGQVIASEYPNSGTVNAHIDALKGDKSLYGHYQSLGNIEIKDSGSAFVTSCKAAGCLYTDVSKLFDGSDSTKWFSSDGGSWDDNSTTFPLEITFSYSEAKAVPTYYLTSGDDDYDRDPADWKLYAKSESGEWQLLDEQKGVGFSGRKQAMSFDIASPVAAKDYKLVIEKNDGGWGTQLSEIALAGYSGGESAITDYKRTLNIDDSIATVTYKKNGINYSREYFVSNPDNFMAIRITCDKEGGISNVIRFTSPQQRSKTEYKDDMIIFTGRPQDHKENIPHLEFAGIVKVVTDGEMVTSQSGISVSGADELIIYFTAGTNYQQCMDDSFDYFSDAVPVDDCMERIKTVSEKAYDDLKTAHMADYHSLYNRVKLNMGFKNVPEKTTKSLLTAYKNEYLSEEDSRYFEALYYQFGRYLLISSSREGSLPANLQGIWADGLTPPWDSDYHTNINIQMNYWLAETTNLTECHMPIVDYINSLVPRGRITAELYHCTEDGQPVRGWTTYHENNIWGNTGPAVSSAFYFPAGAAWMCQDIWEIYAFTQDKEYLERNFNTLLEASLFWVDNLVTDSRDGSLVSSPSYSPEHGPYTLGASCDQEIIWELFDFTLKAADALGKSSSEIDEIKKAKDKLWLPEIGLDGEYLEWKDETALDLTGDYGHRHVNHLFSVHPGTLVVAGRSKEDDRIAESMKKVLNTRGDGGTGWSKAWKINFWARLRDGDHAGVMVNQILKESTYQNLFDTHPPFQIDGNFGATAGMTEMLLQSQGDSIDLLPALPAIWANGSVTGLRARGNVTVSMKWENTRLVQAELTVGTANESLTVSYPGITDAILCDADGSQIKFKKDGGDKISFSAQAGQTYYLIFN